MMTDKWSFRMTPIRIILFLMSLVGVGLTVFRLATGLGVSTSLNDQWPWGLWIGLDLTAVALAGAGYSMAVLSHILHMKNFHAIARRGLLISSLGYIFVLVTLIIEIGRWDNFWRPLVSWGHHSPLFEVFIAITIYMIIQTLEFSEIITEKVFKSYAKYLKWILPAVFFLGALIPFGHQASLGAIYLIFPHKLDPIWYTSMLPWFFLITSFYVGPAMVLLDTLWSSKAYRFKLEINVLRSLAKIGGGIMLGYFAFKVFDLVRVGAIDQVFSGRFEANMFLLEMVVGVAIPGIIAFSPWSGTKSGLTTFSLLSIFGVIMSRVNVVFTGMYKALGPGYVPNFVEWGISIGLFAIVSLAYLYIVENFPIYSHVEEHGHHTEKRQVKLGTTIAK